MAHWFVTFGSDHTFRFWRLDFGIESKWCELTSFKFFEDEEERKMYSAFDPRDVTMIKTDPFGKMLTGMSA